MDRHPDRPELHIGDRVRRDAIRGIPGVVPDSAVCDGTIVSFEEVQMFGSAVATVIQWDDGATYQHIFADFRKIEA